MNIPILKVIVSKDQFSAINKIVPAHEYPLWLAAWGQESLEIVGKSEEVHKIDGIEVSINRIIEKEKGVNDGKNTAKSKDGTRTETRV